MAHTDRPIAGDSPAASLTQPPASPPSAADSQAATAAALKHINTPRSDSLESLISAFSVYDTAFQQRQNDTLVAQAAAHCHSLCADSGGGWDCLQGCTVQMLQAMAVVQERFVEQQRQGAAAEETDEEEDEDEDEYEVVVAVGEEDVDESAAEAERAQDQHMTSAADEPDATSPDPTASEKFDT